MRTLIVSLSVAAAAVGLQAHTAEAQGVITACSTYGKGCLTAPTRQTRFGREVRMPGGTWIGCKGDCRKALTDETVNFWQKREIENYLCMESVLLAYARHEQSDDLFGRAEARV